MSSNLRVDTSMDFEANSFEQDQKRQLLLQQMANNEAENARLAAQLAELAPLQLSSSQSSNHHHRSPIQKQSHQSHQRRGSNVPRSASSTGVPALSRHLSDRNDMSQRTRALSQRSATSMARTNSRGTSSQRPKVPFTQNGAIPPPLNPEPLQESSVIMDWASQEQPYTTYTFSHPNSQLQLPTSQRTGLQQISELEDPAEWLMRTLGSTYPSAMSSPATIDNHQLETSPFTQPVPSTPTTESLTTATTLASEMSRQSSSLCHGVESMQFTSNNFSNDSYNDQSMFDHVSSFSTSSHHSHCSSNEEQSQLLAGTGGAGQQSKVSPFLFPSSDTFGGTKMGKSESIESISSTSSSSSSRNFKRLHDHIAAGQARPIMPKGGSESLPMTRENSSQLMARMESKDGLQDRLSISKPSYKRPQHDRVFCKLCDNHPDGFRGEHEHRRHVDREHKLMVKKWICIEPTDGGQHPRPVVPLARCKACSQQKKKYGAYYNAAAHLRRAHFNPKQKGRSKSQQKVDDADKRGGKGGGDDPDMPELKKYWIKEVEVRADHLIDAQKETADDSGDELLDTSFDDQSYIQQPISGISNISFDTSIFNNINNNNNLGHYSSTANLNENNIYGITDMPLDFSDSRQQVYPLSNQTEFPPFSAELFQSDLVEFPPTFVLPQSYDNFGQWNN